MTNNTKNKRRTKSQTTIYKTLHSKDQAIEQHEPNKNQGYAVPDPHATPVVLPCYKPGDMSRMRKRPDCNYDIQYISVVICDTDTLDTRTTAQLQRQKERNLEQHELDMTVICFAVTIYIQP
jgi:hypothetical protein